MANSWRRWMKGPKHGMARGVAVYGTGCEPRRREDLLSQCRQLRSWADLHGVILAGVPEDLARLDEAICEWGGGPQAAGWLGHEAALFAGTVITGHVQGASWKVWPNGHPVVRTASGCDLDVVALVNDRMARGQPGLAALYADTAAGRLP